MRGAKNQSGILSLGFDAEAGPGDPFGDPLWKRVVAQGGAPQAGIYFERATHEYEDIKSPFNLDTTHQDNSGELMLGCVLDSNVFTLLLTCHTAASTRSTIRAISIT